jgi:hypothetical protein
MHVHIVKDLTLHQRCFSSSVFLPFSTTCDSASDSFLRGDCILGVLIYCYAMRSNRFHQVSSGGKVADVRSCSLVMCVFTYTTINSTTGFGVPPPPVGLHPSCAIASYKYRYILLLYFDIDVLLYEWVPRITFKMDNEELMVGEKEGEIVEGVTYYNLFFLSSPSFFLSSHGTYLFIYIYCILYNIYNVQDYN